MIADRGRRSNGRWSTPARSVWTIRRRGAREGRSGGSSGPKPVHSRTSADSQAAARWDAGTSSRINGSNAPPAAFAAMIARRSASIGDEMRTRAMADETASRDLALSTSAGSTLRVTAGVTLHAALFEHEGLAAFRALGVQALAEELRRVARLLFQLDVRLDGSTEFVERLDGRLHAGLLHPDVPLDRLRDRIGDRVDALAVVDRDPRAADAFELIDDLVDRDPGSKAERDQSGDPFRKRCRVSAAAANLGEDFEQAL